MKYSKLIEISKRKDLYGIYIGCKRDLRVKSFESFCKLHIKLTKRY